MQSLLRGPRCLHLHTCTLKYRDYSMVSPVHLPFPLLGKIVGLQQITSFFVRIGLPCLKLGQTSPPRVVTQQSAFLECWGDFPSLCWDWNFRSYKQQGSHSNILGCQIVGLQLWEGKSDSPTIGKEGIPTTIFPKKSPFYCIPTHFNNFRKEKRGLSRIDFPS